MDEHLSGVSERASSVAQRLAALQAAIIAVGTALAINAFNKAKAFEGALVDLNKVLAESEQGALPGIKKQVMALSDQYGQSATFILQSVANFKQAGYTVQESAELTKTSMDLVIAGDVKAAEASEMLVATLKGFNAPASDAARLLDVLNGVSNNYATSVLELGRGMAGISPIASQMGLSFEETAGILTPVIEVFRSGDEAAIALKTGLLKLIDNAKPVREALTGIGVSQRDANGNLRSGRDILIDVAKAFTTLKEDQKLFVTQQIVGIDQAARMVKVFDGLNKTTEITATAMNSLGSAQAEVDARLKTSEVAVQRLAVGFENLQKTIGEKYRAEVTGVINGVTDMENAMRSAVDAGSLDELFQALNPQLEKLESLFKTVAANLPKALEGVDFSRAIDALGGLHGEMGDLFESIFGNINLETVDGLQELIQRLVDGFAGLTDISAGLLNGLEPLFDLFGQGINYLSNMDGELRQAGGRSASTSSSVASAFRPRLVRNLAQSMPISSWLSFVVWP